MEWAKCRLPQAGCKRGRVCTLAPNGTKILRGPPGPTQYLSTFVCGRGRVIRSRLSAFTVVLLFVRLSGVIDKLSKERRGNTSMVTR